MNAWRGQMAEALEAFVQVAGLAGEPVGRDEILVEHCPAPHRQPSCLPRGKMAVYAFWREGRWLKIGKAGPNSNARYCSQHYTGSAMSTLAGSMIKDQALENDPDVDWEHLGAWIKKSTCRVNILLPAERSMALLSLLEAFLHARLKPVYEGNTRW